MNELKNKLNELKNFTPVDLAAGQVLRGNGDPQFQFKVLRHDGAGVVSMNPPDRDPNQLVGVFSTQLDAKLSPLVGQPIYVVSPTGPDVGPVTHTDAGVYDDLMRAREVERAELDGLTKEECHTRWLMNRSNLETGRPPYVEMTSAQVAMAKQREREREAIRRDLIDRDRLRFLREQAEQRARDRILRDRAEQRERDRVRVDLEVEPWE